MVLEWKLGGHRAASRSPKIDPEMQDVLIPARYTAFEAMGQLTVLQLPVQGLVIGRALGSPHLLANAASLARKSWLCRDQGA